MGIFWGKGKCRNGKPIPSKPIPRPFGQAGKASGGLFLPSRKHVRTSAFFHILLLPSPLRESCPSCKSCLEKSLRLLRLCGKLCLLCVPCVLCGFSMPALAGFNVFQCSTLRVLGGFQARRFFRGRDKRSPQTRGWKPHPPRILSNFLRASFSPRFFDFAKHWQNQGKIAKHWQKCDGGDAVATSAALCAASSLLPSSFFTSYFSR